MIVGHITTEELGLEDYASAAAQAKQVGHVCYVLHTTFDFP